MGKMETSYFMFSCQRSYIKVRLSNTSSSYWFLHHNVRGVLVCSWYPVINQWYLLQVPIACKVSFAASTFLNGGQNSDWNCTHIVLCTCTCTDVCIVMLLLLNLMKLFILKSSITFILGSYCFVVLGKYQYLNKCRSRICALIFIFRNLVTNWYNCNPNESPWITEYKPQYKIIHWVSTINYSI